MENNSNGNGELKNEGGLEGLYERWFLDYASYVILERAVPAVEDGLKPVQRRILHAMREMDDGRFNKVANIIGQTMQYHPHGDASINEAIVHMGQKELLIETQGNWGDIRTGDSPAAPRYIEARLSKFAHEVVFNPQTTEWQLAYDGRKREPVTLPVKFPLLLAQGVEGIAVGLSTKILPHNFCEIIQASIDLLKGKNTSIFPDFPTGGMADFTDYNEGRRGGRVRLRTTIEIYDKKTLAIKDVPYGISTNGLIDSIVKANDKGKIKIKKVVDNTAKEVEILVYLAQGQSPEVTIDALYAFTDCEISISPNACVIADEKPRFLGVNELLKICNDQTIDLLRKELEIKLADLREKILFASLEQIFIENRIYRNIEEAESWEQVLEIIDQGLEPFKPDFYRKITQDDIIKLTEIKIKRISKYDSFKAEEHMRKLQEDFETTEYNLNHITEFTIKYYNDLLEKFGKGRERKTAIKAFDNISANVVAANNQKLYVNRKEGFIGYGIKKDEYVSECSDLDDIIVFRKDGMAVVKRISEKVFAGKDIIHAAVYKRNDERRVYNIVYVDGKTGRAMVKRFQMPSVIRDREYDLTKGNKGSRLIYFTDNPNGEAEVITVYLTAKCRAKNKVFDFDFSDLEIKGRDAQGNILTKYPIRKIELKSEGVSTLGGLDIWYDDTVGRLNTEKRGVSLGHFRDGDQIIAFYKNGTYEINAFSSNSVEISRYDPEKLMKISKFKPDQVIAAIYYEGKSKKYYVKRFKIETSSVDKIFSFIGDHKQSKLLAVAINGNPEVIVTSQQGKNKEKITNNYYLNDLVDIKGWKALGNQFPEQKFKSIEISKVEEKVEEAADEQNTEQHHHSGEEIEWNIEEEKSQDQSDEQLGLF